MFAISCSHCSSFLGALSTTGSSLRASSGTMSGTTGSCSRTCFSCSNSIVFSRPKFAYMANNFRAFFNSPSSAVMRALASVSCLAITFVFSVCVGRLTHFVCSVAIRIVAPVTCCPSHSMRCWQVPFWVIATNSCTALAFPHAALQFL